MPLDVKGDYVLTCTAVCNLDACIGLIHCPLHGYAAQCIGVSYRHSDNTHVIYKGNTYAYAHTCRAP